MTSGLPLFTRRSTAGVWTVPLTRTALIRDSYTLLVLQGA
jgi:hypothetical protein